MTNEFNTSSTNSEYVHIFIGAEPKNFSSRRMQILKNITTRQIFRNIQKSKKLWGSKLWNNGGYHWDDKRWNNFRHHNKFGWISGKLKKSMSANEITWFWIRLGFGVLAQTYSVACNWIHQWIFIWEIYPPFKTYFDYETTEF